MTNDISQSADLTRRRMLAWTSAGAAALGASTLFPIIDAKAQDMQNGADNFYTSDRVTLEKVGFQSQYRAKVAGNLFLPANRDPAARLPALIVGHPMGAVKE